MLTITHYSEKTPWGTPDHQQKIADGIIMYSTPSHGGYWVSPERLLAMPEQYRACSFTGDNWFEEDSSWCGVVLAFPEHFNADYLKAAKETYNAMYAQRHHQQLLETA